MSDRNKKVEQQANLAQRASQAAAQAGESALSASIRQRLYGGIRPQPKNNAEAFGRALQMFLFPLIDQGMKSWKTRYDARGDFKAFGNEYLERLLRGEKLNPQQQSVLDQYQKNYPELYAAALAKAQQAIQQPPSEQGAQQAPQQTPPPEGINRGALEAALLGDIRVPTSQGTGTTTAQSNLTGESLVNSMPSTEEILAEMSGQNKLEDLIGRYYRGW